MKKIFSLLIVMLLCFNFVGCGKEEPKDPVENPSIDENGESTKDSPAVNLDSDATISYKQNTSVSSVLIKYNYFKEKKLNYTCYEYRFETLDEANKFYDEKKVLDSKEVVVTITDETVFILYINPDDKGASYDSILNKAKSDKAISDIAEY